jgi:uncharacterized protein (TIGR02001 family)
MFIPELVVRALTRPVMNGIACGLAFAGLVVPERAAAQGKLAPEVDFNLGANTDYVFRGISQSNEEPSIFGGVDARLGLGYVGVWASNVDFDNGTDAEVAAYAGVRPKLGPATLDFGVIYYGYIEQPSGSNQDYWEGKVAASVPAGPAVLGAAVYYSPEYFGDSGDAWYYEASALVPIPGTKMTLSGVLGRQTRDIAPSYTTWNAAVGYALTDQLSLELRYWDTAKDRYGDNSSSRVVAGFKVSF